MTKFNYDAQYYDKSSRVQLYGNCNGLTFVNTGDNPVKIDNIILYPGTPGTSVGDSFSIGGNEGEILDRKEIRVAFNQPQTAGQQIMIVQKFYNNVKPL